MPRFLMLLWVPLVVLACFAFGGERAEAEEALASWYGPGFSGLPTASGETYDPYGFTAAHKTMPLGTELLVSYGGSSVEVTVNDRGPYVGARELDLSQGAADAIGLTEAGVDYVEYTSTQQYAPAPLDATATQYAGGTTYSSTSQESYASIETTQYNAGTETVAADQYVATDQYAPVEQYTQAQAAPGAADVPVSEAPAAEPAPEFASGSVLVVRPGETLSGIAAEMGVSLDHLAAQNAVADLNYIYAGQVLYY